MIKFRAWDRTRNEMNYSVMVGNCDIDDENYTCPTIWIEERKEWLHFDDYDSIMQSTGLKDKNGKEIFEGDILKVANNDSSWFEVVKYDHNKAMFISKEMNLKYEVPETPLYDLFSPYLFKVEVIGNIWEDGDLIDGKKANEN